MRFLQTPRGQSLFQRCRPAVLKFWLLAVAGVLWSGVGIALCVTACVWLLPTRWPVNAAGAALGFGSGVLVHRFGFSRIAGRNIDRIAVQPDRVCLFAFQAWRSYLLIVVMVILGYVLRHSHLPLPVLAVIYCAVGTGLALSSTLYYRRLFK